jgi:phage terminase large subunit
VKKLVKLITILLLAILQAIAHPQELDFRMSELKLLIAKHFFNDKFFPYLNLQCPTQIFYGGASSGKSLFLAQRRVIAMIREPRNYLVVRKVADTIRSSVFTETERAINSMQLGKYFNINQSLMEMVYKIDGRKILFRGLDKVEKLHSIIVPSGVLTDIDIEEATEITEDDYDKLDLRMRGLAPCKKRIAMSFNPTFRTHWIASRFFNGLLIKYKYDIAAGLFILHSTHRDNRFLDQQDRCKIESKTGYMKDVYCDGRWGVLGALVFTDWTIGDVKDINFDITRYGLDFGFTSNPSAALKIGILKSEKKLFVQEEVYCFGATNDILAAKIKPMVGSNCVWCDSAEPKSIREMHTYAENSINAYAVAKGRDSVWHSIQWLQQWKIIIDKRCTNTINEISQYQWQKNKDGISINEPVEINDHCIAALRYATERDRLGSTVGISI